MEFIKYPSIENSYRQKFIDKFNIKYNINQFEYVALEKIHGSNIQIIISKNGEVSYASRNMVLGKNDNFQGGLLEARSKLNLTNAINFAVVSGKDIRLFGELFGKGIQKGIDYFDDKRILFFDIMLDDEILSFKDFKDMMNNVFELPIVPIIKEKASLDELLKIDVNKLQSRVNKNIKKENIAEGIVIRPYNKEFFEFKKRFILKYKSDKHTEKQKVKKQKEADPVVNEWKEKVSQYVTESRMSNIFSKYGTIENPSQMGTYIKYYMEDLTEDFLKDYPEFKEQSLDKKQKKEIMNFSKEIVSYLNKEL